jgi:peptide deformylase
VPGLSWDPVTDPDPFRDEDDDYDDDTASPHDE